MNPYPRAWLALLLLPAIVNGEQGYRLDNLAIQAQIVPHTHTTLAAEMGAKIERLAVVEGGSFKRGETLIELDCASRRAQLNKARTELRAAENRHQANQRMAEYDAIGEVELRGSEIEVAMSQADIDHIGTLLAMCRIKAPFSGRVAEQKVRERQYVQAGQPLLEIFDHRHPELEFIVPVAWLGWFRPGYRFEFHLDHLDSRHPVELIRLGARADPISQTIKAVARFIQIEPELIPGLSGQIAVEPPPDHRSSAGAEP